MPIYQRFLSKLYFKKFLLLFMAFEIFFVGIDLLKNLKLLPDSANLQVLYIVNKFLEFIGFTLPLTLIFALIMAVIQIIKSNELVTLYSLGISKTDVAKPFIVISLLITSIYIGLNTLPYFVQAHQNASNIKKRGTITSISSSIFLKSGEDYAYIQELNPAAKTGENMKIFIIEKKDLVKIIEAKEGVFKNDHWELKDITVYEKPHIDKKNLNDLKLLIKRYETKNVLYGFTPRIIDTLFQNSTKLTIQDSFKAIKLFKKQNLKTDKIRANLYKMTIFPLFAPIMVFALFFLFPTQARGSNLTFFTMASIFGSLALWGITLTMTKIANNGTVSAEAGILLPILLLGLGSVYLYKRR